MNNIERFKDCSYCGACVNVCPVGAISVNKDDFFYSPSVDNNKCIECGKCVSVCPVNTLATFDEKRIRGGYAGFVEDECVLIDSSSGGLFHALSQYIIERGGVVYGASFSDDFRSVNFVSSDETDLRKIQKSKYVESDVGRIFGRVKKDLESGRYVLFCGSPCQVAGLRNFLGVDDSKLLLVDFSCGGFPSHKMFNEYIDYLEKKKQSKINWVDFRPKNYGWRWHSIYCAFSNFSKYTEVAMLDPYYKAFLCGLSKRDYCYKCSFSNNHASDIILADFWNHRDTLTGDNKNKGLSLIVTNSDKGDYYFSQIAERIKIQKLPINDASYNIKQTIYNDQLYKKHLAFCEFVEKAGFVEASNKFIRLPVSVLIKDTCKKVLFRQTYKSTIFNDRNKY